MTSDELYAQLVEIGRANVRDLENHATARLLLAGTLPVQSYAAYLSQVVQQVRGSGPMLEAVGVELGARGHSRLAALFHSKSSEENGHDIWALRDLVVLGVDPSTVATALPSAPVVAYNAWTSYAVKYEPIAILGVAWTLEWFGYARAGQAAENLILHSGIPKIESAVSFLRGHSDADYHHIQALAEATKDVLDARERETVVLSARLTGRLYLSFFDLPGAA
jgi:hypothetical protein